eukprot:TRINITY_DN6206_c0_g1_i2.p1 TRINITY_DN6206_c0_g1~~TRINITY_DN6206_c0_g1_i2.p1  ORF type:complete len:489 (+),score=149.51 TRINITY_DN6206_c0_g1_i2:141-1607(+)
MPKWDVKCPGGCKVAYRVREQILEAELLLEQKELDRQKQERERLLRQQAELKYEIQGLKFAAEKRDMTEVLLHMEIEERHVVVATERAERSRDSLLLKAESKQQRDQLVREHANDLGQLRETISNIERRHAAQLAELRRERAVKRVADVMVQANEAHMVGRHMASSWIEMGPSKAMTDEVCTAAALQASKHANRVVEMLGNMRWAEPPGAMSTREQVSSRLECAAALQAVAEAKVELVGQVAHADDSLQALMSAVAKDPTVCSAEGLLKMYQMLIQGTQLVCAGFDVTVDTALLGDAAIQLGPLYVAQNEAGAAMKDSMGALLRVVQSQRCAVAIQWEDWESKVQDSAADIASWKTAYTQVYDLSSSLRKQNSELRRVVKQFESDTAAKAQQIEWLEEGHGMIALKARDEISALQYQIDDLKGTCLPDRQAITPGNFLNLRHEIQEQQKELLVMKTELGETKEEKEEALSRLEQQSIIEDLLCGTTSF